MEAKHKTIERNNMGSCGKRDWGLWREEMKIMREDEKAKRGAQVL